MKNSVKDPSFTAILPAIVSIAAVLAVHVAVVAAGLGAMAAAGAM